MSQNSIEYNNQSTPTSTPFDRLILAIPAPQAATLLSNWPDIAAQIAPMTYEPCWVLLGSGATTAPCTLQQPTDNISRLDVFEKGLWRIECSLDYSTQHLEVDKAQFAAHTQTQIAALLGSSAVIDKTHRWRFARVAHGLKDQHYAVDAAQRVYVAGDGFGLGHIEGAYLSGIAAAAAIVHTSRTAEAETLHSPSRHVQTLLPL